MPIGYSPPPAEIPSFEDEALSEEQTRVIALPAPIADPAALELTLRAVPAARHLARKNGLDPRRIRGTGPDGVLLLRDVEEALKQRQTDDRTGFGFPARSRRPERAGSSQTVPDKVVPLDRLRDIVNKRLTDRISAAPQVCVFTDIWLDPLLNYRRAVLPDFEKKFGLQPSINDFLIKAAALNIQDFPLLNAVWKGREIHIGNEVNIGLVVTGPRGLIVPAIPDAGRAGLNEIARQRSDLVRRARQGKLSRPETERGTFTISNLARYDITHFTPSLAPSQCGALSIGRARETLRLVNGETRSRNIAAFGLAVDHRVVDGRLAADFLQTLKGMLQRPSFTFMAF